jgi:hypothetical protein
VGPNGRSINSYGAICTSPTDNAAAAKEMCQQWCQLLSACTQFWTYDNGKYIGKRPMVLHRKYFRVTSVKLGKL